MNLNLQMNMCISRYDDQITTVITDQKEIYFMLCLYHGQGAALILRLRTLLCTGSRLYVSVANSNV